MYLQRFGGIVRKHLPSKAGLLDGYLACTDYEALTLDRYERYVAMIRDGSPDHVLGFAGNQQMFLTAAMYANSRLVDWMGVRYLMVEKGNWRETEVASLPAKVGTGKLLRRAFTGPKASVFENPSRIPRARLVTDYRVVGEPRAVMPAMLDPTLDPLRTAVVEQPLDLPRATAAAAEATIVTYQPSRVVVDVETDSPGLLVLTDQYDPGWRATVDGVAESILVADYLYRGVPIRTAGKHRVEFTYAPASFRWGAILTALGFVTLVGTNLLVRRRRAG